jgi:hypothetical protein
MLIRHSHAVHTDEERHAYLEALKEKFKERNFDICLYEFYRKNNMVEFLLEERGDRLDSFLANHENIAWIRSIESSMYGKARGLLKNLIFGAKTADKKATIAALAKMCALCEDNVDHNEVAFLTSILTLVEHQESIDKTIAKVCFNYWILNNVFSESIQPIDRLLLVKSSTPTWKKMLLQDS